MRDQSDIDAERLLEWARDKAIQVLLERSARDEVLQRLAEACAKARQGKARQGVGQGPRVIL